MKRAKAPKATFRSCPACGCREFLSVGVDVLCTTCDWSSMQAHVDSGGMDNVFAAYIDHFMTDDDEAQDPVIRQRRIEELQETHLDPADFMIDERDLESA